MVSPSSRGRGLKFQRLWYRLIKAIVALFTRAWIEIPKPRLKRLDDLVALFTRAWIEIAVYRCQHRQYLVALFTRAWIEMRLRKMNQEKLFSRPLHEGVD